MDNITVLRDTMRSLISEMDQITARLLTVDGKEQDILHFIEFGKMNARDGYKLAKALKDIRKERRDLKNRFAELKSATSFYPGVGQKECCQKIISCIDNSSIIKTTPKTYAIRAINMESIVGRKLNKDA